MQLWMWMHWLMHLRHMISNIPTMEGELHPLEAGGQMHSVSVNEDHTLKKAGLPQPCASRAYIHSHGRCTDAIYSCVFGDFVRGSRGCFFHDDVTQWCPVPEKKASRSKLTRRRCNVFGDSVRGSRGCFFHSYLAVEMRKRSELEDVTSDEKT